MLRERRHLLERGDVGKGRAVMRFAAGDFARALGGDPPTTSALHGCFLRTGEDAMPIAVCL